MSKLHALESEIADLYSKVKNCEDVKTAYIYLDKLIKINETLCTMIFMENVEVSDKLWQFFKDFDVAYDNQMHEYFYKKIKGGDYKL